MKGQSRFPNGKFSIPISAALALCCIAISSEAQVFNLADGNSTASVDVGSQRGLFDWQLQGANQLAQQWFWFRVGSGANAPINTISAASVSGFNETRGLTATYANDRFSVRIDYLLNGGDTVHPGAHALASLGQIITINNLSSSTLDFHFFQYSDFNLGAVDRVELSRNARGLWGNAEQSGPGSTGLNEASAVPGANRAEAGLAGGILSRLNGGTDYNLSNQDSAGPGDVAWALQWDFSIAPGHSVGIAADNYLDVLSVPEPSSIALIGLGIATVAFRRRCHAR